MTHQPPRGLASRPSEQLVRAIVAAMRGQAETGGSAETVLARLYPGDQGSAMILRAATSPASLTSPEWAGLATSTAVSDFIANLGPVSAASRLIASSLQVDLGRNSGLLVPGIVPSAAAARFVAEGQPIPVTPLVVGGPTLRPAKIATICVLTRETTQSTAAEPVIRQTLRESVGLALDAAMFGNLAAIQGERPAGLLNGVAALAATAGGGEEAMIADLQRLASAVAGIAGSSIAFIASPDLALRLALRRAELPYPVWASAALSAGTIVSVATNALVTAIDPAPDIDASNQSLVHMDDAPQHIGTPDDADADTAAQVAAPTRSVWQTDCVSLRLILGATWALRTTSGAVAFIAGTTW